MNTATAVKAATAGTVKLTIRQWATEDRPSVKLQMYGVKSLNNLGKARFDEINDVEGVGTSTACKVLAAVELGKRRQNAMAALKPDMGTATRIYNYMLPKMMDLETEHFYILLMNNNYRLIKAECISMGGLTEVSVDVRIVMREAVLNNATIMAICHNHPSGSLHPSKYDDMLTQSVKKACEVMRIHLADHVIVTKEGSNPIKVMPGEKAWLPYSLVMRQE